jgi:YYY domain-containing protein
MMPAEENTAAELSEPVPVNTRHKEKHSIPWIAYILLLGILAAGAYFRFIGLDWDEDQHLHPDERFLTMVETAIRPVSSLKEYFDTGSSPLNPNNAGYTFYVYGTLPIFLVRYAAEAVNMTGYGQVYLVGRALSGIFDLLTVLLVFFLSFRLYRNYRLSLVAAGFMAFAVLPIQLSHYFTVDTFATFFTVLSIAFAVLIMTANREDSGSAQNSVEDDFQEEAPISFWKLDPTFGYYLLFGVAFGMALASKVSSAPAVLTLLVGCLVYYSRVPAFQRKRQSVFIWRNLVFAGIITLLVFRIFQPYAFQGPGFFNVIPNEKWLASLRELSQQSSGNVDFPPALQWARRPVTFAWDNMVKWGMGLPLGLLAWAGFLTMGWRILKREWRDHLLLWSWTGIYFAWQSLNFTRSMRYQMPVYPTLIIIAAWLIFFLWNGLKSRNALLQRTVKITGVVLGTGVFIATFAWAFAFTRIYTRPVTRLEASRWIYQNVYSAINLQVSAGSGVVNIPVAVRNDMPITAAEPVVQMITLDSDAALQSVQLSHIVSISNPDSVDNLVVILSEHPDGSDRLGAGLASAIFSAAEDPRGSSYQVEMNSPVPLQAGKKYFLILQPVSDNSIFYAAGSTQLNFVEGTSTSRQLLPELINAIHPGQDFTTVFSPRQDGTLEKVYLHHAVDWEAVPGNKTLFLTVKDAGSGAVLSQGSVTSDFEPGMDARGEAYTIEMEPVLPVSSGVSYMITLSVTEGDGALALYGDKHAIESSWDDPLPYQVDGYNAFDFYTGIYRSDLNFEMYWDDNSSKLERMLSTLDQADYIYISSNRQYGTTVRVPERYPLTTEYYRQLLGCPQEKDIIWCYNVAEPGKFSGNLGFELAAVFQSNPNLGGWEFNTQFAEEAFTVYDAPKVLIFRKTSAYDSDQVSSILKAVDLTQVVHLTPAQASRYTGNLLLDQNDKILQQAGGTWSELFNRDSVLNRIQPLGVAAWYLVVMLLGWLVTPWLRLGLWGLKDKGYPFARLFGMLLVATLVWLAGSIGIAFSRVTITIVVVLVGFISAGFFFIMRKAILQDLKAHWRHYLTVELLFLALFVIFLMVRLGNPDLWHPYKGGEKPMDLSYFQAVIKSTVFPPYDPWFADGYLNYYYFGYVIVGVLVKWLGIIPTFAYNLILPTLFAMTGAGAFSIGWNLFATDEGDPASKSVGEWIGLHKASLTAGVAGVTGMILVGNLGTVRMIWHGIMRLAPNVDLAASTIIDRLRWTFQGLGTFLSGAALPFARGDWYWIPSRVYPNEPITEFPLFTFLYADLHAHLIDLPVTLLVLGCSIALVKSKWLFEFTSVRMKWLQAAMAVLITSLAVGALKPTNTWDQPAYTIFICVVLFYSAYRYFQFPKNFLPAISSQGKRLGIAIIFAGIVYFLSHLIYLPFSQNFGAGYTAFDLWKGDRSPFWSYIVHWGLFLALIFSWMYWETHQWLSNTPVSALKKLEPYRVVLWAGAAAFVVVTVALVMLDVSIAWLTLPMILWAGILILRPDISDNKRLVLFMTGTGLLLTLVVELVVLRGDIGRMNTVFKFYYQAWTMLSLSAAASLAWLLPEVNNRWKNGWRFAWQTGVVILTASALLFTILATADKVTDRISENIPSSLDGMTYMQVSTYNDMGNILDLNADYKAIRWMQDNVKGSPVIVEANTTEYRWGSRYTIYTGLPGVVGWNWHQRQQRTSVSSDWVTNRVAAVEQFYATEDQQTTETFLQRYGVQYIIVGGLERSLYPATSLAKFETWNNYLWTEVYRDGYTVIYRVK